MLTYSALNKKNYLNMENDIFEWMILEKNSKKF